MSDHAPQTLEWCRRGNYVVEVRRRRQDKDLGPWTFTAAFAERQDAYDFYGRIHQHALARVVDPSLGVPNPERDRDLERSIDQLVRVRQYRDLVHRIRSDVSRELDNSTLNAVRRADLEQQQRVLAQLDDDLRRVQKLLEALTEL